MMPPEITETWHFPAGPIDYGILGHDLWFAWNRLVSAIMQIQCAQPRQMTEAAAILDEARKTMQLAMRNRNNDAAKAEAANASDPTQTIAIADLAAAYAAPSEEGEDCQGNGGRLAGHNQR